MSLSIYEFHAPFSQRLFLSCTLDATHLQNLILNNFSAYQGASIRTYDPLIGSILKVFGLAVEWQINQQTYYFNTKSLQKFFYRLFLVIPAFEDLSCRVEKQSEYLKLPISPLASKILQEKSAFKICSTGWMRMMTGRYVMLLKYGYDNTILHKLKPDFLLKVLSGKI